VPTDPFVSHRRLLEPSLHCDAAAAPGEVWPTTALADASAPEVDMAWLMTDPRPCASRRMTDGSPLTSSVPSPSPSPLWTASVDLPLVEDVDESRCWGGWPPGAAQPFPPWASGPPAEDGDAPLPPPDVRLTLWGPLLWDGDAEAAAMAAAMTEEDAWWG
jgi:hypothetical protein